VNRSVGFLGVLITLAPHLEFGGAGGGGTTGALFAILAAACSGSGRCRRARRRRRTARGRSSPASSSRARPSRGRAVLITLAPHLEFGGAGGGGTTGALFAILAAACSAERRGVADRHRVGERQEGQAGKAREHAAGADDAAQHVPLSALAFTLMSAGVKTLADRFPTGEIVFFRSFIANEERRGVADRHRVGERQEGQAGKAREHAAGADDALAFTLMSAGVKTLADRFPTGEIVFFRSFIAIAPLLGSPPRRRAAGRTGRQSPRTCRRRR
jgi:hypothetical protein